MRTLLVMAGLLGMIATSVATAEEVPLFRPDSLIGWDHGKQPISGWTMNEGQLSGKANATQLLSGFAFGPGELHFHYQVADDGRFELLLHPIPAGEALRWVLEADRFSIWQDNTQLIAPTKLPQQADTHAAQVALKDNKLSFSLDGKQVAQIQHQTRLVPGLKVTAGKVILSKCKLQEPMGKPLFNGKDLSGWWTPGNLKSWVVEDGNLVCINKGGNYLRTDEEYGNYTLSLEYKIRKGGNSGIGIRTPRNGWPSGDGMELQILDQNPDSKLSRSSTMGLYGNLEPLDRADRREEWNQVVVKAEGYLISAWVNGVLCQHSNTALLPELQYRNLQGWIGFQDHGARIEFRNIHLLAAPEGRSLKRWYVPQGQSPSESVIGRLLNPKLLTQAELPTKSEYVTKQVEPNSEEQELVVCEGPGALVGLAASENQGELCFYFDDETKPRVTGRASALKGKFLSLTEHQRPLVTYAPFAKRLRVTVRDLKQPNTVRLEVVKFAPGVTLQSFDPAKPEAEVSRGLLPALSYRRQQHGWGRIRTLEPFPRPSGEVKELAPGETATVVEFEGPGLAQWTQLKTNPSVVQNDDLWLEITIDNQSKPSIAAPVRYWFAGLQGGRNRQNFLITLAPQGMTNRLPIPFGKRFQLALSNHGDQPLRKLRATALIEPPQEGETPANRWQLHARFERDGSESIAQSGPGLWLGFVQEVSQQDPQTQTKLAVDGSTEAGWKSLRFADLLGAPQAGESFRAVLSGHEQDLAWRYFLLAPQRFERSLELSAEEGSFSGDRLVLFYLPR